MPDPLSEDEIDRIVDDAIAENGATSLRDMGRVMADVTPQIAGRADGSAVSQLVREKLAGSRRSTSAWAGGMSTKAARGAPRSRGPGRWSPGGPPLGTPSSPP